MTNTPARRWPKTGNVGASTQLRDDEQTVTVPARPYPGEEVVVPLSNRVPLGDLVPALRRLDDPPTPAELRKMADSLNAHGGFDETFVAALLREVAAELNTKAHVVRIGPPEPPDCSAGRHIWSTTSPVRCVECRRYLRPWWRRALDRVLRRRPR